MLLTISTTHAPATDLGFLLAKHPQRVQEFDLSFGKAQVFYPEVSLERCTCALVLDVDPVGLVRRSDGQGIDQYVNDRPYVCSSFMSIALSQVFGSALNGRSQARPELVDQVLPLEATLAVLPCRGGESLLRQLFEPLGYTVTAQGSLLDDQFPEWGASPYFTVHVAAQKRLRDLLSHLYVLIPVLDDEKHYWVGSDEIDKLLRHGEGWLDQHPARELIAYRYLKRKSYLARQALARLSDGGFEPAEEKEEALEQPLSLNDQRLGTVIAVLKQQGATRILDLGCGEGNLLRRLMADPSFSQICGVDVSLRALEIAADRLRLDQLPAVQKARIQLLQGSLTYRDERLKGYAAATVIEVIEHLDLGRLASFERILFTQIRPPLILLTTPNQEHNVRFESLTAGSFRHRDHRFEWSRAEFQIWASKMSETYGYQVRFLPIGQDDPEVGAPTQMAIFNVLHPGG